MQCSTAEVYLEQRNWNHAQGRAGDGMFVTVTVMFENSQKSFCK